MNKNPPQSRGADTSAAAAPIHNTNSCIRSRIYRCRHGMLYNNNAIIMGVALVIVLLLRISGGESVELSSSSSSSRIASVTTTMGNVTAQIVAADLMANNGVVHKIDHVLLPEFWNTNVMELATDSEFSMFFDTLATFGLTYMFTKIKYPKTVFAPTNAAWRAVFGDIPLIENMSLLPENLRTNSMDLFKNHILFGIYPLSSLSLKSPGTATTTVQGVLHDDDNDGTVQLTETRATIVRSNLLANNGIIHVIDKVLTEPFVVVNPTSKNSATASAKVATRLRRKNLDNNNVTDVILAESDLSTYANALSTVGLADALDSIDGNCYTIFAPTNDAFAALDQDYWKTLLTPPWIFHLTNLLSFHISYPTVNRVILSDLVVVDEETTMTMLNNETISVAARGGG